MYVCVYMCVHRHKLEHREAQVGKDQGYSPLIKKNPTHHPKFIPEGNIPPIAVALEI